MSETREKRLAIQAQWAAVARLISPTTSQRLGALAAKKTGTTASAATSMTVFLAALRLHPELISRPVIHPPPMLPIALTL